MSRVLILPLLVISLVPSAITLHFGISRFDPTSTEVSYKGDARPDVGTVDMTSQLYYCHFGHVVYNGRLRLWDSSSGKLADFTTHFAFTVDVGGRPTYGAGLAFFMDPVGFQIPVNSVGGFLALYNTTYSNSSRNQIIHVEFDTYANPGWDPNYNHVGINQNSIASNFTTPWNITYHSGDTIDETMSYNTVDDWIKRKYLFIIENIFLV